MQHAPEQHFLEQPRDHHKGHDQQNPFRNAAGSQDVLEQFRRKQRFQLIGQRQNQVGQPLDFIADDGQCQANEHAQRQHPSADGPQAQD
ncbi:MAG: hypothetical protein Q9P14_18225 [candidate division KSB1 bacterium]|nr:hypothetical protein [candidate division KSB1 bacterium]